MHIYFIYLKSDIYILDNEHYIIIYYKYKYYNPSLLLLPIFIFINYYIVGFYKKLGILYPIADIRGVGISSLSKFIYLLTTTPIDSIHSH